MRNFDLFVPTLLVFGRGCIARLGGGAARRAPLVPLGARVLLVTGGGSVRRNGVLDQVTSALSGWDIVEFAGVEPNPEYDTLMKAVAVVKETGRDFILAVGGGSVLDGCKFIAAAARFEPGESEDDKEPWCLCIGMRPQPPPALPVGAVLTLPATGSEMNNGAVVSRHALKAKRGGPLYNFPVFSVLDPSTTFSLPPRQLGNGIVDAFVHCVEQYLTFDVVTPLQDRQAEAVMLTLVEEAPMIMDPARREDYDVRANFMWCCTQALNQTLRCGVVSDWSTHIIGHEFTALYGLDHGQSLAVILPGVMAHQRAQKRGKLLQFAQRVWGITGRDEDSVIDRAIAATEAFFASAQCPTRLAAYKIDAAEAAEKVCEQLAPRAPFGEHDDITVEDVKKIILMRA